MIILKRDFSFTEVGAIEPWYCRLFFKRHICVSIENSPLIGKRNKQFNFMCKRSNKLQQIVTKDKFRF